MFKSFFMEAVNMKKFKAYSAGYFSPFIWNFRDPSVRIAGSPNAS